MVRIYLKGESLTEAIGGSPPKISLSAAPCCIKPSALKQTKAKLEF